MDTQTGMRAFSSQLCDDFLALKGERYKYEMNVLMYCARQNIPIVEVPIKTIYHDKRNSYSHFRKIRDSFKIYQQLFKFTLISFSSFVIDYLLFFLFIHILPNTLTMVSIIVLNIELRRKFTFLLWEK